MTKKSVASKPTKPTHDAEQSKRSGRRLVPVNQDTSDDSSKSATRMQDVGTSTGKRRLSERIGKNLPIYMDEDSSESKSAATRMQDVGTSTGKRRFSERIRKNHPIYIDEDSSESKGNSEEGTPNIKSQRTTEYLPINKQYTKPVMSAPIYEIQHTSETEEMNVDNSGRKNPLSLLTFNVKKRRSGLAAPKTVAATVIETDDPGSSIRLSELSNYKYQHDEVDSLAKQLVVLDKELEVIHKRQEAVKASYSEAMSKMKQLQDRLLVKDMLVAKSKDEREGAVLILKAGFGGSLDISPLGKNK